MGCAAGNCRYKEGVGTLAFVPPATGRVHQVKELVAVRRIVGLDIGATGVRGVQVRSSRRGPVVERAAVRSFEPGAVANGKIVDEAAVVAEVRALWRAARFTTRDVVVGVGASEVLSRQIDVPWMSDDELQTALPFQLGDALPVPVSSVYVDYHPIADWEDVDEHGHVSPMRRILAVAVERDTVDAYARVVVNSGLKPVAADASAFALLRLAERSSVFADVDPMEAPAEAIIDLGADVLLMIIHQGGQPRLVRALSNAGGNAVIRNLRQQFDLSYEDAEAVKRRVGLTGPAPLVAPLAESSVFGLMPANTAGASTDTLASEALTVINPWAAAMMSFARATLDIYNKSDQGTHPVTMVRFVGGGSYLGGLVDRLTAELQLPVTILDPLAGVRVKDAVRDVFTDRAAKLAVATGLAMRDGGR